MEPQIINHEGSATKTWIIIGLIVTGILAKGLFTWSVVGDRKMPTWDYGTIADVPGESPWAVYDKLPNPQHVEGRNGK